jgi:hypothetical protein
MESETPMTRTREEIITNLPKGLAKVKNPLPSKTHNLLLLFFRLKLLRPHGRLFPSRPQQRWGRGRVVGLHAAIQRKRLETLGQGKLKKWLPLAPPQIARLLILGAESLSDSPAIEGAMVSQY